MSEDPLKQQPGEFRGCGMTIRFRDVTFAYDDKAAVEKIDMTVEEGSRVALVGESGSGKSTLAKLLVHYYDVDEGAITVGGQDIRDMESVRCPQRQDSLCVPGSVLVQHIHSGKYKAGAAVGVSGRR